MLGPLDGLQGAQVQFPDGSVLVQLDSLDEVLGAGQRGLGGMSQELLGNLRLNIQPGVERVHQGGAGDAGVHSVSRHAGNGGQFRQGAGEVDHGGLGAGVDGHLVDGIESSDGSNVADDTTGTALALVPEVQNGRRGVDQASVVDGNGALDLVIVQDTSSVDQDIDGLQLGEDGLQQLGGLGNGHGHIIGVEGDGHLWIDCLQLGNGSRVLNAVEDHQVLQIALEQLLAGVQTNASQTGNENHVLVGQSKRHGDFFFALAGSFDLFQLEEGSVSCWFPVRVGPVFIGRSVQQKLRLRRAFHYLPLRDLGYVRRLLSRRRQRCLVYGLFLFFGTHGLFLFGILYRQSFFYISILILVLVLVLVYYMPDAWKITARLHALAFEIANEGTAPINRDELC